MASLLDRMRSNRKVLKQGSSPLTETSNEELQGLASQAGMPSTPSSPMGAEGIGANADQAKMLGTPAQDQGALRMQTRESDQLSTNNRQEQARKQATTEEQQKQTQALKLEGLGSLGDRVQQIATGMLNQTSAGANQIQKAMKADTTKVGQYLAPGADAQQTTDLLNKLGSNQISDQEMVQLAGNLGYTDVSNLPELKTAIGNEMLSKEEQVGAFTADQIANNVTVSQFTPDQLKTLGFDTIDDFAAALGTDAQALQGMNIRQLQDQFGKQQLDNFAASQKAQAVIADPNASRAMKEEALKELKELGATGVRSAESDVRKIEEQVNKADKVEFGGESYSVGDLLKDDTIKGLVKTYLTDPEEAKALKEKEPQFAQWIEDNQKVLASAASDVDARQESFAKVQLDNMKLGETDAGKLSDSAMKAIIPNFGKLSADPLQAPPFLSMIKNKEIPDNTAADMINTMNDLSSIAPEYVQSMAGLNPQEINQLGLNTSAGIRAYRDYVKTTSDILKAPEDDIVGSMTGGLMNEQDLKDMMISNDALRSFGLGDVHDSDLALLKGWGEGGVKGLRDKYVEMSGGLNAQGQPLTVRDMLDKGLKPTNVEGSAYKLSNLQSAISTQGQSNDLFRKYGDLWKGDGQLTPSEAMNIGNQMLSKTDVNQYYELENLKGQGGIGQAAFDQLNYYQDKTGETVAQNTLNGLGYGNRANWDTDLQALHTGGFDEAKVNKMQGAMEELANQMTNNKSFRGSAFQTHMTYRVNQMASAIADNIKKIPVEDQPDKAVEQIKNMAKLVKYLPAGGISGGLDAYREINKFTEDKLGISLPFADGVEAVNKKLDKVSEAIAASGREFFQDPKRVMAAVATMGVTEGVRAVRNATSEAVNNVASTVSDTASTVEDKADVRKWH